MVSVPRSVAQAMMHRVFALDVLVGPRCGSRLSGIATVQHPAVVRSMGLLDPLGSVD
jgi:hypothetical protein